MDFDREYELGSAGIDAFDFSLIDEDERSEDFRDAGLDLDNYEMMGQNLSHNLLTEKLYQCMIIEEMG